MGSSKLRLRPEVVDWAVVQARSQILGSGFVTRLGRNLSIPIAPEWSAILPLFGLWKSRPYIQAVHNRPGHGRTVSVHGVRSRAEFVDEPSDHLLADATLPRQEHRRGGGHDATHLLHQAPHRRPAPPRAPTDAGRAERERPAAVAISARRNSGSPPRGRRRGTPASRPGDRCERAHEGGTPGSVLGRLPARLDGAPCPHFCKGPSTPL
jgi:hypothetical protein